jgi:hypothetical protein
LRLAFLLLLTEFRRDDASNLTAGAKGTWYEQESLAKVSSGTPLGAVQIL